MGCACQLVVEENDDDDDDDVSHPAVPSRFSSWRCDMFHSYRQFHVT